PERQELNPWQGQRAARSPLAEANARIRQAETFAWTVPGLAIAAESFLLGAAPSKGMSPRQQAVACSAGIVILAAALHFLAKHAFNFRVYEAVIERARKELGLPFVAMSELVGSPTPNEIRDSFPAHTELVQRGWLDPRGRRRLWRSPRNWFARRLRSVFVWSVTILALIGLDIWVLVRALGRI